jgi:hypothetical protein
MTKILIILISVFTFSANATLIQHVVNGDFEAGSISSWNGSGQWNITSVDSNSGTFSATVEGNFQIFQNFTSVSAVNISQVSFWMKQPEDLFSYVSLFYDDASEVGSTIFLGGSDWNFFDITDWLDLSKNLSGIGFYGYSGGSSLPDITFLDDVSITSQGNVSVPEPSALALLVLGMIGLGARRFKK